MINIARFHGIPLSKNRRALIFAYRYLQHRFSKRTDVSDPVPDFSSGLRYEKQRAQIVPRLFECMNSLVSITSVVRRLRKPQILLPEPNSAVLVLDKSGNRTSARLILGSIPLLSQDA